jgi:hypothetical protein
MSSVQGPKAPRSEENGHLAACKVPGHSEEQAWSDGLNLFSWQLCWIGTLSAEIPVLMREKPWPGIPYPSTDLDGSLQSCVLSAETPLQLHASFSR